jgi:hypothetical protein
VSGRDSNANAVLTALLGAGILGVVATQTVLVLSNLLRAHPATHVFTEDAFYVFSVARNVAAGRGITIDGVHATNGFQPLWTPLWTLLCVLPYRTFGSDLAVFAALYLMSLACGVIAAWMLVKLVSEFLPEGPWRSTVLSFAVLWLVADREVQLSPGR